MKIEGKLDHVRVVNGKIFCCNFRKPPKADMKRNWTALIEEINKKHALLKRKPRRLKLGYQISPEGILNAFREGDLTFKQAADSLRRWKKR